MSSFEGQPTRFILLGMLAPAPQPTCAAQWADTKQLPLPRGPVAQLCRHCGAHCNSKDAMLVQSSRAQRRRQLQADTHTQNRCAASARRMNGMHAFKHTYISCTCVCRRSECRVAAVIPCQASPCSTEAAAILTCSMRQSPCCRCAAALMSGLL